MKKLDTVRTYRQKDSPPGGTETQETNFDYDGMGRATWTIFPDGSSELSDYELGQLSAFKTRKDQTKRLHYDARGRELYHTWDGGAAPRVDRIWDDASRMTRIWNIFSIIDYSYDEAGQVRTEGTTVTGSALREVRYCRNPNGEVSQITYPNGTVVNRFYTPRGQLQGVGWGAGSTSYAYLRDGRVDYQAFSGTGGVWTKYEYDGRGMTGSVWHRNASGQSLAYREYWRDDRDRITAWKRGSGGGLNGMENGQGNRYGYDAEGQLTSASYRAATPEGTPTGALRADSFSYDALGNRQGSNYLASRGAMTFERDDNGLNQYSGWWPYSVINHDDDLPGWGEGGRANGVVMQEGWITGFYNALNQPVGVTTSGWNGSGNWMWFGYDPLGRCVKRWVGPHAGIPPNQLPPANTNPATYYYYEGWNLIQEGLSGGTPERVYVHGGRVDEWSPLGKDDIDGKPEGRVSGRRTSQIVASWAGGDWSQHQYDAQGNCILLTDTNGGIREQYDYDAFGFPYTYDSGGNSVPASTQWGNRFLFTGREWIKELRLYDYRNRLYQPELGRFLQPDPSGFEPGDYNLYRYCHNDPINKNDPTGLAETFVKAEVERRVKSIESHIERWVKVGTLTAQFKGDSWQAAAHSAARLAATMAKNTASEHYGIVVHRKGSNEFYGTYPIPSGMKGQFYGGYAQASDLSDLRVRGYERAAGYWSVAGHMDLGKNGWPTHADGTNDLDKVKGHMNAVLAIPAMKTRAGQTFREHSGESFGPEWDSQGRRK